MIHVCFKQNSCCMVHLSPCGLSICEWGRGKGGGVKGLLYPHQIPLKITCVPDRDKIFFVYVFEIIINIKNMSCWQSEWWLCMSDKDAVREYCDFYLADGIHHFYNTTCSVIYTFIVPIINDNKQIKQWSNSSMCKCLRKGENGTSIKLLSRNNKYIWFSIYKNWIKPILGMIADLSVCWGIFLCYLYYHHWNPWLINCPLFLILSIAIIKRNKAYN